MSDRIDLELDQHIDTVGLLYDIKPHIHAAGQILSHLGIQKVLICGNGGSAADSQHFAAELMIRYRKERKAVPCISLATDTSVLTAGGNDLGFASIFERQVEALGRPGDVLIAVSTSGSSENVLRAVRAADRLEMLTIGMTGSKGMPCDVNIKVPSDVTARIQECHILILHILCEIVEAGL